jgi:hypothetical protein
MQPETLRVCLKGSADATAAAATGADDLNPAYLP